MGKLALPADALRPERARQIGAWHNPAPPAANDNIAAAIRSEWKAKLPSFSQVAVRDGAPMRAINSNDKDVLASMVEAALRKAADVERSLPTDRPSEFRTSWPQAPRGWADYNSETVKMARLGATPAQISRMDWLYGLLLTLPGRERRIVYSMAHRRGLRAIAKDLGQTVHRVRTDYRVALRCLGFVILTGRLPASGSEIGHGGR